MRTGVIATKLGMSRYFNEFGVDIPVTLLKLDGCKVVAVKTKAKDGYDSVQLGAGNIKSKNVSKSVRGHFAKAKVEVRSKVVEFRVANDALLEVGQEVTVNHYVPGQIVDIAGTTKGKGFAGGMKRHNFRGLEASHGVSISHRSSGSVGQCQDPGKIFKGKKMPGHMGDVRVTMQNLEVMAVDEEKGLIIIAGSVPGSKGSNVLVYDAVKRARPAEAPYPAGLKGSNSKAEEVAPAAEVKEDNKEEQGKSDES